MDGGEMSEEKREERKPIYLKLESAAYWLRPGKCHFGFSLKDENGQPYGFEVTCHTNFQEMMMKAIQRMDTVTPWPEEKKEVVIHEVQPGS